MTVQIALCDDETAELTKAEKLLSAYEQQHTDIDFEVEASQYLLKPIQSDRVFSLLDRFQKESEEEREGCILLRQVSGS